MALKLDNNLLEEPGLGQLPDQEKQLLLRQIYEKLEMNVGVRLADQMSNEQLDEFEKFVDANDDKGAFQWLESNFPNYKEVVNQEFEKLKAEIKQYAPQMLAVAAQNSQAGPSSQAPPAGDVPGAAPEPVQGPPQQGTAQFQAGHPFIPGSAGPAPQYPPAGGYPQQPQAPQFPQSPQHGQVAPVNPAQYGQPGGPVHGQPYGPAAPMPGQPGHPNQPAQHPAGGYPAQPQPGFPNHAGQQQPPAGPGQ